MAFRNTLGPQTGVVEPNLRITRLRRADSETGCTELEGGGLT